MKRINLVDLSIRQLFVAVLFGYKPDKNFILCPLENRIYVTYRHKVVAETIESFQTSQISSYVQRFSNYCTDNYARWSQRYLSMTLRTFDALSFLVYSVSKNNNVFVMLVYFEQCDSIEHSCAFYPTATATLSLALISRLLLGVSCINRMTLNLLQLMNTFILLPTNV